MIALLLSVSLLWANQFEIFNGKVEFLAKGKPGFLKIQGQGARVVGQVNCEKDPCTTTASVDLNQLTTGIALRDQHMKETYLETSPYPQATLNLSFPKNTLTQSELKSHAQLSLHGLTKEVPISCTKSNDNFDCNFAINIDEFNIAVPKFSGITVASIVDVSITGQLKEIK